MRSSLFMVLPKEPALCRLPQRRCPSLLIVACLSFRFRFPSYSDESVSRRRSGTRSMDSAGRAVYIDTFLLHGFQCSADGGGEGIRRSRDAQLTKSNCCIALAVVLRNPRRVRFIESLSTTAVAAVGKD